MMEQDLDAALRRLSAMPTHPGLVSIEGAVLERLHEPAAATPRQGIGMGAAVAIAALMLGVAIGSPRASAVPNTLSPFGPASPLAPSTLLTAGR
jgi:ferric-dicitrate binding protein FerR (iron transport regulator)